MMVSAVAATPHDDGGGGGGGGGAAVALPLLALLAPLALAFDEP